MQVITKFETLEQLLQAKNVKNKDLAKLFGKSEATISKWLNKPLADQLTLNQVKKIINYLGYSMAVDVTEI